MARLISKYKPNVNNLACPVSLDLIKQLNVAYGDTGYKILSYQDTENLIQRKVSEDLRKD